MAADFGWWYFNQSRLQNAADAAVLARANQIADEYRNSQKNVNSTVDFVNEVPANATLQSSIPNFSKEHAITATETAE